MKTKSKLVLGLSILSAATLAAGATSTFAWYQVGSAANATGKAAQYAQFTASTDKKNAGTLSFVLSVTLTPVGNSGNATDTNVPANLQMVNFYDDSGTIKKQFGYYVQGESSPRYQDSGWGESPYWIVYKARVSVTGATIEGVTYSDAEAGHLLNAAGETYTLTVSADGAFTAVENATAEEVANYNAKYGASYSVGDTLPAVVASRAKFYEATSSASAPTALLGTPESYAITTGHKVADAAYEDFYFGMYIEGDGVNDGTTAPNGNFTVSFS